MSEHTKGPWELGEFHYPDDGKIGRCEIRQDMGILAHVYLPAKNQTGFKEGQANARLIAAAPKTKKQRDKLVTTINNALATLAVMSMPALDNNVATNEELLKIMGDSFEQAIKESK